MRCSGVPCPSTIHRSENPGFQVVRLDSCMMMWTLSSPNAFAMRSTYFAATYNVSESGHALRNLEVSKRFAKQIKQVILEKIGPGIAAR